MGRTPCVARTDSQCEGLERGYGAGDRAPGRWRAQRWEGELLGSGRDLALEVEKQHKSGCDSAVIAFGRRS